jgi:hypothetical protein
VDQARRSIAASRVVDELLQSLTPQQELEAEIKVSRLGASSLSIELIPIQRLASLVFDGGTGRFVAKGDSMTMPVDTVSYEEKSAAFVVASDTTTVVDELKSALMALWL